MLTVTRYTPDMADAWNDFVAGCRNATFLHNRNYMDYHRERFTDASLIIRDEKQHIVALLPANIADDRIVSHGGLTYGGLLINNHADAMTVCQAFDAIIEFYRQLGIKEFIYKPVPAIYAKVPSDEELYALFLHSAQLDVVNISSTIALNDSPGYNENTRRNIRRARKEGVTIVPSDDLATFHDILSTLLKSRFNTSPVHTLAELQHLAGLFPDNIRLLMAMKDGKAVAGSLLYITDTVVHAQYIAATEEGKTCDALSLLFDHAISEARAQGKRYFDFGTCNENRGQYLNEGLIRQKNGFGGRGIAYPSFTIKI
jgi:hypothetical protein